jgi:cellulose biosynthesis protein BcsQ
MKSIAFFNNKGGVGKTTLICNVASIFATEFHKRVAVIDCDPQCNSTQLILGSEGLESIYAVKSSKSSLGYVTKPLKVGDRKPNLDIIPVSENSFGVSLLAGHPDLSIIEDKLSANWGQVMAGEVEGFRVNLWLKYLIDSIRDSYDYIFIDVGPSLGALNRSVLLACDGFLTPLGADIFSIMGIENIGTWLSDWTQKYTAGYANLNTDYAEEYSVPGQIGICRGFIGYTVQQYTTKTDKSGERRKVIAFDNIIKKMPSSIKEALGPYAVPNAGDLNLGDIPYLYSLVPLAQDANVPIHMLSAEHGLRGSRYTLANKYKKEMISLATAVRNRTIS